MRRTIISIAGVLALSLAGFLAMFGLPSVSSAQPTNVKQYPAPSPAQWWQNVQLRPVTAQPPRVPTPRWSIQPGQVRTYVWVWYVDTAGRRYPGKPAKVFNYRGPQLLGWQTAHSEHWREVPLKPGVRVCVVPFERNAVVSPCQPVSFQPAGFMGQRLVFTIWVSAPKQVPPTTTRPGPTGFGPEVVIQIDCRVSPFSALVQVRTSSGMREIIEGCDFFKKLEVPVGDTIQVCVFGRGSPSAVVLVVNGKVGKYKCITTKKGVRVITVVVTIDACTDIAGFQPSVPQGLTRNPVIGTCLPTTPPPTTPPPTTPPPTTPPPTTPPPTTPPPTTPDACPNLPGIQPAGYDCAIDPNP